MNDKTKRMLELLDGQIQGCTLCDLYRNGRCKPYWSEESKYAIILEAPGKDEIDNNTPVIGKAGKILWETMDFFDLKREDFLIINSVNCRPVEGNKNAKPTDEELSLCRCWLRKYIKVLQPKKMIISGNYSLFTMTGEKGIMSKNGQSGFCFEFQVPVVYSVHPAMSLYNASKGKEKLYESIKAFKSL
jgi:DNA polymerase